MKVNLPHDPEWKALDWAKENCPSYITNRSVAGAISDSDLRLWGIDYYFSDEKDATLFMLRWIGREG